MAESNITIRVDTSELDTAIEKASRLRRESEIAMKNMTRLQRRQRGAQIICRIVCTVLLTALILLALSLDGPTAATNDTAHYAARAAAVEEYERIVELYGDETGARIRAEEVYQEVLASWAAHE